MTMRRPHSKQVRLVTALALSCLVGMAGCGDSETGGSGGTLTNNAANNDTNNEPGFDLSLAAAVDVKLDPARAVYKVGATVTPQATVLNGNGEPMPGAEVTWTVEPADAVTDESGAYKLDAEGELTFEACTVEAGVEGAPVCGKKRIVVDDAPPTVEVISPAPGEWLNPGTAAEITVEGKVTDTHSDVHAFVNGRGVDLDDQGNFTTTIDAEFGINHIEVVATDGRTSATGQALLDVLWAPNYYATANTASETAFGFDDGLVLDLGQRFFDDGQAPQQPDETTYMTDDLVDILVLLVKNIDFMSQIPDPVLDTESGQLRITDLALGEPQVMLELTDGGAEMFIWIPDVELTTQGGISFDQQVLDLTGSIDAEIAGFASLSIDKPGAGQQFVANVDEVDISIQSAESNFASPEANAVFALAESALRGKIEEMVIGTLRSQFVDELPTLLTDALNSIEQQLTDLSFDLDTEFTDPLTITLNGEVSDFATTYRNSMTATIGTNITANQPPALTTSPGIPLATSYTEELPLFESSRAQVGVRLALLNGLLHTLWETGFLEIDLTDLMPDQYAGITEQANLSVKLQPVLSRPKAGEPYDFILRAGQMEIEADLANQTDVYAVNLEVGILMSLADNAISITVPDEPQVTTWVKSTTGDRSVLNANAIKSLVLGQVWPQIEETLKQGLSFELPVPSLSGISDLAPTLTALEVEFLLNRPVDYRNGFIIFDALLQGTLPLGQ
ncbi:hypothetical protein FIV42_26130 [Persicimonas caeni]|uniref:Carboxypeptidase regulatory-like domain-containing protein n=1 Tax=Persicimonas caeni TaxID=2292766 RepID=A0A4Y6Q0Q0_PERCE|nr:hypothetical protein [Persicimonas caeni]QDG54092.1 hypothetical protein FIV42_26130 [Persicimonas caeni]QED35313.1 hypothetical protein FRD00_26125 [Persicimonas caeni]